MTVPAKTTGAMDSGLSPLRGAPGMTAGNCYRADADLASKERYNPLNQL
jgi:hypothetical protein